MREFAKLQRERNFFFYDKKHESKRVLKISVKKSKLVKVEDIKTSAYEIF